MTKKEKFIEFIQSEVFDQYCPEERPNEDWEDILTYWEAFNKGKVEVEKPAFTDNGKMILKFMQEHIADMSMAKAKDIAEGLFISSRAVSGALRKLVTDGYFEKIGENPVVYTLTDKGKSVEIVD